MRDLLARLRDWLGVPHTSDAEKQHVERVLTDQRRRLAALDAGIPPDRRVRLAPMHPQRRLGDRR